MVEDSDHVGKLIQAAVRAAENAPESLREVAFQEAFRYLSADGRTREVVDPAPPPTDSNGADSPETSSDRLTAFRKVDRSHHPGITSELNVLDRAVLLLSVAETVGLDWMTAPEIVRVLKEKFRVSTPLTSVSDALGKSTLVDRVKEGRAYKYRLTDAGERYVQGLSSGAPSVSEPVRRKAKARKGRRARNVAIQEPSAIAGKKPSRGSGRPGPKALVEQLIAAGYFNSPRTVADIVEHAKNSLGHAYPAGDLTPALVRLLREQKLKRERSENGQFEYSA